MEECVALKDRIEELIQAGQLRRFVRNGGIRNRHSPEPRGKGYVGRREERFERRDDSRCERKEGRMERRDERGYHNPQRRKSCGRSLTRPVRSFINTISRGFVGGGMSSSARKRHLMNARFVNHIFKKRSLPPMLFTN